MTISPGNWRTADLDPPSIHIYWPSSIAWQSFVYTWFSFAIAGCKAKLIHAISLREDNCHKNIKLVILREMISFHTYVLLVLKHFPFQLKDPMNGQIWSVFPFEKSKHFNNWKRFSIIRVSDLLFCSSGRDWVIIAEYRRNLAIKELKLGVEQRTGVYWKDGRALSNWRIPLPLIK